MPALKWKNAILIKSLVFSGFFILPLQADQIELQHAEALFSEGLFQDALPLYKASLHSSQWLDFKKKRIAGCLLELEQPQEAILTLQGTASPYLLAYAYRWLGQYETALRILEEADSNKTEEEWLEEGLNAFYAQQFFRAYQALQILDSSSPFYPLAQVYLAHIELLEGSRTQAKQRLDRLSVSEPAALRRKKSYLTGLVHFFDQDYPSALSYFKQALPAFSVKREAWETDALYYMARSYQKASEPENLSIQAKKELWEQSEKCLEQLAQVAEEETLFLAWIEFFLTKAKSLNDFQAYHMAQSLLSQSAFFSGESKNKLLLLQAELAASPLDKASFYHRLMENLNLHDPLYLQTHYFKQKHQAIFHLQQGSLESLKQAWDLVFPFFISCPSALNGKEQERLDQLSLLIAQSLISQDRSFLTSIEQSMASASSLRDAHRRLLAFLYLHLEYWQAAEQQFNTLIQDYPASLYLSEAYFWRAHCLVKTDPQSKQIQACLEYIFTHDPSSPYAPHAYFGYYSLRHYLQGSRKAIRHLQAMPLSFPRIPLLMHAYYLIGLDYKKDRLTEEGKVQRHRNLTAAIDAFQMVESTFDDFYQQGMISHQELAYYTGLKFRSVLERALSNLAIAEESEGSKQQIYLQYAQDVFQQLIDACHQEPFLSLCWPKETYPPALEEAEYGLVQTYLRQGQKEQAKKLLETMLQRYQAAKTKQGYFLTKTWQALGLLHQEDCQFEQALAAFSSAEESWHPSASAHADLKLELWIQQSLCYKELGLLEEAMRLLSQVVNEEVISTLRLKAMFLRADLYDLQGRPELCLKQLEALAKKGGEWGKKAQIKLEERYGY